MRGMVVLVSCSATPPASGISYACPVSFSMNRTYCSPSLFNAYAPATGFRESCRKRRSDATKPESPLESPPISWRSVSVCGTSSPEHGLNGKSLVTPPVFPPPQKYHTSPPAKRRKKKIPRPIQSVFFDEGCSSGFIPVRGRTRTHLSALVPGYR